MELPIRVRRFSQKIMRTFNNNIFYFGRYPRGYLFGFDGSIWNEVSGEVERFLRNILPYKDLSAYWVKEIMADLCQFLYREEMPQEPPWELIKFKNGVLNVATGQMENHSGVGQGEPPFFLSQIPHEYDPQIEGEPSFIDNLFGTWASTYKVLLYEIVGYLMLRCDRAKKFFTLYGEGDNGKTTFADLIRMILGRESCSSLTMDEILSDRFALALLRGKLVNISGELVPTIKRTDRLKQLTGGDPIFGQEKFRTGFFFQPYTRFIFPGNIVPQTSDSSEAFYTRTLIIPFSNTFPPGRRKTNILAGVTEEEIQRFLKKLVTKILPPFIDRGFTFCISPAVNDLRKQWDALSNPLKGFIDELFRSDLKDLNFIPSKIMMARYQEYRRKNKVPELSPNQFAMGMKGEGFIHKNRRLSEGEIVCFKKLGFDVTSPCRGWLVTA